MADYQASTDDVIEQLIGSKDEIGPKEKMYLENTLKRWQAFANRQGDDQRSRAVRAEGHFRVGELWEKLGRNEQARAEFLVALELRKKLVEQFPAVPEYQRSLGFTHSSLGWELNFLRKFNESRPEYLAALEIFRKLNDQFPGVPDYQTRLAGTHHLLALSSRALGNSDDERAQ